MGKGSKTGGCRSASHKLFKDKAKNRVDDLQGIFIDLQSARKESRASDIAVLEEQVHQMLREWKAELNESSPASSLIGGSIDSSNLSSDIRRLLQLCEEEDDATSVLVGQEDLKPEPDVQNFQPGETANFQETYYVNSTSLDGTLHGTSPCKETPTMDLHHVTVINNLNANNHSAYQQFDLHHDYSHSVFVDFDGMGHHREVATNNFSGFFPGVCPPPSAFLGPKCALWDCPRPAQGSNWWQDYCSSFHATLAFKEGPPGMTPVLRSGGIDLKDGPLFAALSAKTIGKDVGIPECEGAATAKSPWNATELFDLSVLEGETLREWLFFDKPRRAFESGNRKQRSLPDYNGRGWHESRKQVMKEFGGLKRSYYMDPQPSNRYEWHLYEYEINNCDVCALYRLELKLVDAKRSPKVKVMAEPLSDLQQQMGKLSAQFPLDQKRTTKGRAKVHKDTARTVYPTPNQLLPLNDSYAYGLGATDGYFVDSLSNYYRS